MELPRQSVADFLDSIDRQLCARYLEFLINERKETEPRFHDRLAESYLSMTLSAKKKGNPRNNTYLVLLLRSRWIKHAELQKEFYSKLLHFIDTTDHYRTERLYGILSSEGVCCVWYFDCSLSWRSVQHRSVWSSSHSSWTTWQARSSTGTIRVPTAGL